MLIIAILLFFHMIFLFLPIHGQVCIADNTLKKPNSVCVEKFRLIFCEVLDEMENLLEILEFNVLEKGLDHFEELLMSIHSLFD